MRFSGDVKNKTVLDVGCWIGWYEKLASSSNIVGLDLDYKALLEAKKNNPLNDFVYASALYLPFKDHCFDQVSIFDVLEHLSSGKEFLSEASRVLYYDVGLLLVSNPNDSFFSKLLDPAYFLIGHRHYSLEKLEEILQDEFRIVRFEYGGSFYDAFSVFMLYPFKHLLGLEIPFKGWLEKKREKEYQGKGFETLFVKAVRT